MAKKRKLTKEMGFRLKQARTEQKLTYEELAEKIRRFLTLYQRNRKSWKRAKP